MGSLTRSDNVVSGAVTLALLMLGGCGPKPDVKLWEPANWEGKPNLPPQAAQGEPVLYVRFNLNQIQSPAASRIELPLPDGTSLLLIQSGSERLGKGGFVWYGKVEGDEKSMATLSILEGTLVGDVVMSNGRIYRIDQVTDDVQVIFRIDPGAFPAEAKALSANKPIGGVPVLGIMCPQHRIEVMAVYTEAACAASFTGLANGCSPFARFVLRNKIQMAEVETNLIFANSLIKPRISVVHVAFVGGYDEAETLDVDLKRLKLRGDEEKGDLGSEIAYLEDIHGWRDQHRADVVSLITKSTLGYDNAATPDDESAPCGVATLLPGKFDWFERDAFTAVPEDCVLSNYSFGHELAHVMGADHDAESSRGPTSFAYNRGFLRTDTPASVQPWRTLMAENNDSCMERDSEIGCTRLPYLSNPALKYQGDDMGIDDVADNALVVSETAATVANFRPSLNCGNP
jgi:hypothetical protein